MEIVLSQFVKSLAESGLLNDDEIQAFVGHLPPEKKPDDGADLARELVRQKRLTRFQAQAVYQGKSKALILGDYVVLDRIGQGGMGQVFKAEHKGMKLHPDATKPEPSFQGVMVECRVSDVARYTEDFTPQRRFEPDGHTVALYHFDEGSGDVLKDSSGNGHDGRIVGAKWVAIDKQLRVVGRTDDSDRSVAE